MLEYLEWKGTHRIHNSFFSLLGTMKVEKKTKLSKCFPRLFLIFNLMMRHIRIYDIGLPAGYCEYVLLPLANKEAALAYGKAE